MYSHRVCPPVTRLLISFGEEVGVEDSSKYWHYICKAVCLLISDETVELGAFSDTQRRIGPRHPGQGVEAESYRDTSSGDFPENPETSPI